MQIQLIAGIFELRLRLYLLFVDLVFVAIGTREMRFYQGIISNFALQIVLSILTLINQTPSVMPTCINMARNEPSFFTVYINTLMEPF